MFDCCINIDICWIEGKDIQCNIFTPTKDGSGGYFFTFLGEIFTITYDIDRWNLKDSLGNLFARIEPEDSTDCPAYDRGWSIASEKLVSVNSTEIECKIDECKCGIKFTYFTRTDGNVIQRVFENVGEFNGQHVFQGTISNQLVSVWFDGVSKWMMTFGDILDGVVGTTLAIMVQDIRNIGCPFTDTINDDTWEIYWNKDALNIYHSSGNDCNPIRCTNEDRIYRNYASVTLPDDNIEDDRGNKDCCCEQLVLGSQSANTWENDITPAWIKLDQSGTAEIKLLKDGEPTVYAMNILPIIRESNAFYVEVNWGDVLNSDGAGCYTIEIEYNIAGIVGSVLWGNYKLMPYSINNAMYTARVRAVFNSYFYKDNIDFTDTNMQGTLRFSGLIGRRQPNTEIDNIIYGTREMKSVIRENLNTYEILTDPLDECITKPLLDLYLLHENNLFISDYNYHNHSYLYNDLPVILEESADVTYYDWSRKASIVAKVGDKVKNNMNYYK
jgi:hypothetical protein